MKCCNKICYVVVPCIKLNPRVKKKKKVRGPGSTLSREKIIPFFCIFLYFYFQRPLMALLLAMLVTEDDKDEDQHGVSLTALNTLINVMISITVLMFNNYSTSVRWKCDDREPTRCLALSWLQSSPS